MNTRNHLADWGVAGGILYEFASKTRINEGGYRRTLIFMISHCLYLLPRRFCSTEPLYDSNKSIGKCGYKQYTITRILQ